MHVYWFEKSDDSFYKNALLFQNKSSVDLERYKDLRDFTGLDFDPEISRVFVFLDDVEEENLKAFYKMHETICTDSFFVIARDDKDKSKLNFIKDRLQLINTPVSKVEVIAALYEVFQECKVDLDHDFVPLKTAVIKVFSEIPFDIYVKLSEKKFSKIVSAGSFNVKDVFEKFEDRKVDEVFITRGDLEKNRNSIFNFVPTSSDDQHEKMKEANAFLQNMISVIGINQVTMDIATSLATGVVDNFSSGSPLDIFVKKAISDVESGFTYAHSYMTSIVATSLGKLLGWDTNTIIKKIVTASLIHDAYLNDNELTITHDLYPDRINELSSEGKSRLQNHIISYSKLLDSNTDVDSEIIYMITHSHETPSGEGYPGNHSAEEMRSIQGVFLISHKLVIELYKVNFDKNKISEILTQIYEEYNRGNFKKIATAFKKAFM